MHFFLRLPWTWKLCSLYPSWQTKKVRSCYEEEDKEKEDQATTTPALASRFPEEKRSWLIHLCWFLFLSFCSSPSSSRLFFSSPPRSSQSREQWKTQTREKLKPRRARNFMILQHIAIRCSFRRVCLWAILPSSVKSHEEELLSICPSVCLPDQEKIFKIVQPNRRAVVLYI